MRLGSSCLVKPSRRDSRFTWVSTGNAGSPPRCTVTTPAVFGPTPGSAASSARAVGTSPPCCSATAAAIPFSALALARKKPQLWIIVSSSGVSASASERASG